MGGTVPPSPPIYIHGMVRENVTFIFIPPGLKAMEDCWILFQNGTPVQDETLVTAGFMYY
jgi:hypothetical protein